jgi:hypothetical protein
LIAAVASDSSAPAERLGDPLRINHPRRERPRAAAVIFDNIARRKFLMNLAA